MQRQDNFSCTEVLLSAMSRRGFVVPSPDKQLAGIGLSSGAKTVENTNLYGRLPKQRVREFFEALRVCINPSDGDWEDLDPPQRGEWLEAMLDKTPDQSFKSYVESRPNRPDRSRNVIYLQPICEPGDLDAPPYPKGPWPSWTVLQAATEHFFAPLTVKALPALSMTKLGRRIPSRMGSWGVEQFDAAMVLDALQPRVPSDAYGLMAVTMCDLYPKPEWNFVYGLARLTARVGIFSFVRHTPRGGLGEAWLGAQLLHRSLKTLLHEIGHMFGLKHCTWYNCLMRGSNGEGVEHQVNHLYLCPVCLRKLHWNIGFDIPERYAGLLKVFEEHAAHENFAHDCAFLQRRLAKLETLPPGSTMISDLKPSGPQALGDVPQPRGVRDSTRFLGGDVRRPRAKSTSAVAKNLSSLASAAYAEDSLREVHTPECPCCNPRKEPFFSGPKRFSGRQRNFDAENARKLLEEMEGKLSVQKSTGQRS